MCAVHANGEWCRIEAGDGGYNPTIADRVDENGNPIEVPEPEWPLTENFGQVLRIAFKKGGRVIDNLDHPLIKRLRG